MKYHKFCGLNRNLLFTVLEARSPRARCLAGLAPSEGHEGESLPGPCLASDGLLVIFSIPWLVGASPRSLPSSPHGVLPMCFSILVQISPFYKNTVILN